jgi:UDP-N-acetylmuramate dehydrogenase
MSIEKGVSLKKYNTLGLDISANFFLISSDINEIINILNDPSYKDEKILVLGGGSNLLFKGDYQGLVIKPDFKDISIVRDFEDTLFIRCGSGVEWDFFVEYCVDRGWGGLENLSYIPGTVGASPVQNIGAYGSEVKESIVSVEYIDIRDLSYKSIDSDDIQFAYRDSIFKNELKDTAIITYVTFKLSKFPTFNVDYQDVRAHLEGVDCDLDLFVIRDAITAIRKNKLPEPSEIGNVGSFFKNPIVSSSVALELQEKYPNLIIYNLNNGLSKIPAAWLIDNCGYKGVREGNVGVHHNQALVLIAYDGATGQELINFAEKIKRSVKNRFNIDIEPEVNIVN